VYQIALIFIFIFSFEGAMNLGDNYISEKGGYVTDPFEESTFGRKYPPTGIVHGVSITSGLNGGALGMSIISASCLFLISFMELKLYQQNL
jgi:hypothetical protein